MQNNHIEGDLNMDTELFELYKNLIRCRAVSADIEAVNKSEKLLLAYLQKQGLYCTEEMIDGRVVVYASTMPGKVQDLLLNAHLDVVPAAYEEQFEPRVEGDRLYGRGAHDCLGNAMAIIQCLLKAKDKYSVGAVSNISCVASSDVLSCDIPFIVCC